MNRRPLPESECLAGPEQARIIAGADRSEDMALFLSLLARLHPGNLGRARVLELGCGSGDLLFGVLRTHSEAIGEGLDRSPAMVALAEEALAQFPGLIPRCRLCVDPPAGATLPEAVYDLILSNGLLHQLPRPEGLWERIRRMARPGARVLVMDLMRPASAGWVEALVQTYAAEAPEILQTVFRNALFAAYEPNEVAAQLAAAGLPGLELAVVSDRHLAVMGRLSTEE